jgi:3-isopropylmalate/(R)-2-methylmalate dehydratase small subunit
MTLSNERVEALSLAGKSARRTKVIYEGRAWKLGDDVDTDAIIPGRYLTTSDMGALAEHCLEDLSPGFAKKVSRGDVVVAGWNFGCGSSREHAPAVMKAIGISVVLAASFARIFYRNAFNLGLPAVQSPEAAGAIRDGDRVRVNVAEGWIQDLTVGESFRFEPVPSFMLELIESGGLTDLLRKGGWKWHG